ncbi:adenosylcobinamide-GDP ribazoletransferase [Stappia sp. WLB 29]|uniref:adenosylcobinamide-GDP ribazoletransferase n=1 Tax=Stappia sp. WLB 29 TaxID=2925220 RepID=UPI0020C01689|nr:adenosylcobinamide-GDP ribazoletransferase [Stappia sp. WLB 29]
MKPEAEIPHDRIADPVLRSAADLAACLRFFSRVPFPAVNRLDDLSQLPAFSRAAWLVPVAGALLALPPALLLTLLGLTDLPPLAASLLAVAFAMTLTGALHEDGLADVADGFFGASRRERRLEIMKDSRIGAFGTLALVVCVGLRAVLLAALMERVGALSAALLLILAEAVSRAAMVGVWTALAPTRPDGLAAASGQPSSRAATAAVLLGLAAALAGLALLPALTVFAALLLAATAATGTALLARARIGGHTGDVLGATQQLTLIGLLLGFCLAR